MDDCNISDLVRAQKWEEVAKKIQTLPPSADAARLISLVLSLAFDAGHLAGMTDALAIVQLRYFAE